MYGSVSPIPMADPMNMYGAYQTVNPAMYYNTVNPQMYATRNMQFMPGMQPGIGQANPSPQPYMQSQDGASSPGQSGHNLVVPAATPNVGQVANQTGSQSQADSQQSTQNVGTLNAGMQASVMPGQAMSSFYSSVPGQNQIMPQAGFPFMMQASSMPVPFPQAAQSDTNQGLDTGAPQPSLQSNSNAQAAAYQSAMHQAAAAYHAAAEAYRSVSGQAPVGATPTNAPANSELDQSKGGLGE